MFSAAAPDQRDSYREERRALQGEMAVMKSLQQNFGLPEHEVHIEDFSCAVRRRILLHGRMWISSEHLSFRSDIFGLKTTIVLPFREIVSIRCAQASPPLAGRGRPGRPTARSRQTGSLAHARAQAGNDGPD